MTTPVRVRRTRARPRADMADPFVGNGVWTVSSLVDRQLILPGSADRRNGYGIDTTSVHR